MKPLGKDILSLIVAAVLATGLLWASDKLTRSLIEKQEQEKAATIFTELLPADHFDALSTVDNKPITAAYRAFDKQNRLLGFAVTVQVEGYVGPITVHTALSADATTVYGIRIGEQRETVGYGAGITETTFLSQFQNRTPPVSLAEGGRLLQDGVYRAAENRASYPHCRLSAQAYHQAEKSRKRPLYISSEPQYQALQPCAFPMFLSEFQKELPHGLKRLYAGIDTCSF